MLYYACATDYPLAAFAGATACSYATIGLIKQVAWIVALRTIATRLKTEGFEVLGSVTQDMDPVTKCVTWSQPASQVAIWHRESRTLNSSPDEKRVVDVGRYIMAFIGAAGLAIIAYKVFMALKRCRQSSPEQDSAESEQSNPSLGAHEHEHRVERRRLPTLPLSAESGDERVNAAVREVFET